MTRTDRCFWTRCFWNRCFWIGPGSWFSRAALVLPLAWLATLVLGIAPASAITIDFDDLSDLSDAAAATLPGAALSPAQVSSEASIGVLLGFAADGVWATSGSRGILNSLGPVIGFTFDVPVLSFSVDVLGIDKDGVTLPIALRGFQGDSLTATVISDPAQLGDSGFHEQRLALAGGLFTRVEIAALTLCGGEPCLSQEGTTFFADTATFSPIPEPGTLGMLLIGLTALSSRRMHR